MRNEFVGDLLRALKQRGVPVAGADRLALAEELAVQDLIALGRFLLLPEDDLTLATVLKGPFFGFSEDALFELAYNRGEDRLWTRLRRLARQQPVMRQAYDRLRALLARADFVPPFELYAEILGTGSEPGTGNGRRARRLPSITGYLGSESRVRDGGRAAALGRYSPHDEAILRTHGDSLAAGGSCGRGRRWGRCATGPCRRPGTRGAGR